MRIPLVDLKAEFQEIRSEVYEKFDEIFESMHLILGPNTEAFEREFAEFCGARHAVGVSSGTDALSVALHALGIGRGDEVITTAFTFFATIESIIHAGATPVFADISPDTYTLDPALAERAITPRTKAIVPVHLYGQMVEMNELQAIATRHNLRIIEDCAQAHGAEIDLGGKVRCAGSIGEVGTFSFYFSKNLGAYGEGGLCTTNDDELAAKMRMLRHHGHASKFEHELVGFNFRMDEMQAAVLRVKLPRLEHGNESRRRNAGLYRKYLADANVVLPVERANGRHVYHVFAVLVEERDRVVQALTKKGIGTGIHYKYPCHLQRAAEHLGFRPGSLPVTESVASCVLSLPMYPSLSEDQIAEVAGAVKTVVGERVGQVALA